MIPSLSRPIYSFIEDLYKTDETFHSALSRAREAYPNLPSQPVSSFDVVNRFTGEVLGDSQPDYLEEWLIEHQNPIERLVAPQGIERPYSAEAELRDAYRHYYGSLESARDIGFFPALVAGVGHELEGIIKKDPHRETIQDLINNFLGLKSYITGEELPMEELHYREPHKALDALIKLYDKKSPPAESYY